MDALDVRFDDMLAESVDRFEAQLQSRFDMLDKCLYAADKCWSVFTSSELPDEEARNLIARMAPGGQIPLPLVTFPSRMDLNSFVEQAGHLNGYVFDVHPSIRNLHNAAHKFGLVETLVRLGALVWDADPSPWWYRGLIFDLASVASLGAFFALFGPRGSPPANVGDSWMLISTVNRIFFDHEEVAAELLSKTAPILAGRMRLPMPAFVAFLCSAREAYYRHLSDHGISFDEVFAVTRPDMPDQVMQCQRP